MRINNNLMAMNTHRQLGVATNAGAKATEKLSSGFRINRAGDDAAGLAISEKMRGQIRGLNMASRNAQDGISLIQTAEGALQETHAILQRMRELAVQSANDTNIAVDRSEIQKEMNELIDEIDRIARDTEFNEQKLLDGTFEGKKFHIGANTNQDITLNINAMGSASSVGDGGGTSVTSFDDETVAVGGKEFTLDGTYTGTEDMTLKLQAVQEGEDYKWQYSEDDGATWTDISNGATETVKGITIKAPSEDATSAETKDITLEAGTDGGTGGGLGIDSLKVEGVTKDTDEGGIMTQTEASAAITTIQTAIETVSAERSKLGAYQNRLEHTIKNLDTSAENLQAAEARVRDVDMAKEIMEFTKQNILQQASTAMLAQANMAPQSVLQLLG